MPATTCTQRKMSWSQLLSSGSMKLSSRKRSLYFDPCVEKETVAVADYRRDSAPRFRRSYRHNVVMPKRSFDELFELMKTLRGPGGCPWDRKQTLSALKPFIIEEAYEVVDAIDGNDRDSLREEVGDLLLEG